MKGAQVLDFICSAEGKKVLDSISDSLCVKDQITLLSAKKDKRECNLQLEWQLTANLAKEEMEPINVCSYLVQLKICILGSLTNICGRNFGNFVKKLVDIDHHSFAEVYGCC
ncbi:hypothetical protein Bpfe_023882 [Biomphalaria pfeifferi]|uniref:Uncharacterized protein n=1 Tax=Biomphalaria pfeifferi TaxID=112525 RepID=A0AAD8B2B8_BIOPF|nr:hypothetical protein Bpfe_023882 [Biomphalaria pfeifferi]